MRAAAAELDFERAARLRDDIGALRRALEKTRRRPARRHRRRRVRPRRGRARGGGPGLPRPRRPGPRPARLGGREGRGRRHRRTWSSTCCSRSTAASRRGAVPREVLVPVLPDDADERRGVAQRGCAAARVDIRVPQRGDKRALLETVARNAGQALALHKTAPGRRPHHPQPGPGGDPGGARTWPRRRCGSSASTSRTSRAPTWWPRWWSSRTACRASASTGGSPITRRATGHGRHRGDARGAHPPVPPLPRRAADERAELDARPTDDVDRRHGRAQPDRPGHGRPRSSPTRRNLVVVDGGPPQVGRRGRALAELGIDDVAVCGLAKRLEEVWLPGRGVPGRPAAHQRGAVPAAAGAGRGAPVRDHVPPAAALARR